MRIPTEGKLLRIIVGEADRWHGRVLYEAIVEEARRRGLKVTDTEVIKFSAGGFRDFTRIASSDPPVVIEIVDAPEKIEAFLPELDAMVQEGLVTVERAQVILYRGPDKPRG